MQVKKKINWVCAPQKPLKWFLMNVLSRCKPIGTCGDGFIQSMKILDGGRISIAALSLGVAKGAYNAALGYSKNANNLENPSVVFREFHLSWSIWPPKLKRLP